MFDYEEYLKMKARVRTLTVCGVILALTIVILELR